jgi:hypothetical protein
MFQRLAPTLVLAELVTLAGCPGKAPTGMHFDSGKDYWLNWPESGVPGTREAGNGDRMGDGQCLGDRRFNDRRIRDGGGVTCPGCNGCCLTGGICRSGDSPAQCGAKGAACVDCAAVSGTCVAGLGCCSCKGKHCGDDDGCGSPCKVGTGCSPSCQQLLDQKGLPSAGQICCEFGCGIVEAGATYDCAHCCAATAGQTSCRLPTCAELLAKLGLPNLGMGCCFDGCAANQAGGPGTTSNCNYCCPSTQVGWSACK